MPYVDIGTFEGLLSDEKKKEIALKVRSLLAQEIGKPEETFLVMATGIPQEEWKARVTTLREDKQVLIDFGQK